MKGRFLNSLLGVAITATLCASPVFAQGTGPNILFVFDSSGSMMEPLDGKTKLETAKNVLSALVGDLPPNINVGLEVYGHRKGGCDDIEMIFPVGKLNVAALKQKISALQASGKTPIATSLEKAAGELRGLKNSTIVLISDGKETCGGDPVGIAELIKNEFGIDVVIHVVGFGVDDAVKKQLSKIAQAGGGDYYAANNAQQLKQSLVKIKEKAVEPPKELSVEEFNDPFLSETWEVVNDDPNARVLDEGKFLIVTALGSIPEGTVSNMLLYNGEIPGQNYAVTTEFITTILTYPDFAAERAANISQRTGLIFYLDKDNYIGVTVCGMRGNIVVQFFKRQGGKSVPDPTGEGVAIRGATTDPATYLLKIERRKHKYTAYYYDPEAKEGEGEWKKVGTHAMLGKKLRPGLFAYRVGAATEVVTEFDSFKITELQK